MNKLRKKTIKIWRSATSSTRSSPHHTPLATPATANEYHLSHVGTFGTSKITCTAYDPELRLLAVATACALHIYMLGTEFDTCIDPDPACTSDFTHMAFSTGAGYLMLVNRANSVFVLDLAAQQWHTVPGTAMCAGIPGSPWIFIGGADGRTLVRSLVSGRGTYEIPALSQRTCPVVAILAHPLDAALVLLVYYDGSAVVWNSVNQHVLADLPRIHWGSLVPRHTVPVHPTCASWHPIGTFIAIGFDIGWICVWKFAKSGELKTIAVFPVVSSVDFFYNYTDKDGADHVAGPVHKLAWASEPLADFPDRNSIYAVGGGDGSVVRLIYNHNKLISSAPSDIHALRLDPIFGMVVDFELLFSESPWIFSNPTHILVFSNTGHVQAQGISSDEERGELILPLGIEIGSMQTIHQIRTMSDLDLDSNPTLLQLLSPDLDPDSLTGIKQVTLSVLSTQSGIHILDMTRLRPAVKSRLSVNYEFMKGVILDRLPADILDDPEILAEWYAGISIAWVTVDWARVCMYIGMENGMVLELGTSPWTTSNHAEPKPPISALSEPTELARPDSELNPINEANADPPQTEPNNPSQPASPKLPSLEWIQISLSPTERDSLKDRVFVPHRLMVPTRPKLIHLACKFNNLLAVCSRTGMLDIYDTDSRSPFQSNFDLNLEHHASQLAPYVTQKKTFASFNQAAGPESEHTPTALIWYNSSPDGILRLLVASSAFVFVYQLVDRSLNFQCCVEEQFKTLVLDLVLVPNLLINTPDLECTMGLAVVTLNSVWVFDMVNFGFISKWKSKLHGQISAIQPLLDPAQDTDTSIPINQPKLLLVTEKAVVVLDFPSLEITSEMPHGIEIPGNHRCVSTTPDPRIIIAQGDDRVCVLGCYKDKPLLNELPLTFRRVHATEYPIPRNTAAKPNAVSLPLLAEDTEQFLVPLPPKPPVLQPGRLNAILSYLPFGTASGSALGQNSVPNNQKMNEIFGATSEMNQVMDVLGKRGEHLDLLENKASELNNTASRFAQLAKKIREDQEKKF